MGLLFVLHEQDPTPRHDCRLRHMAYLADSGGWVHETALSALLVAATPISQARPGASTIRECGNEAGVNDHVGVIERSTNHLLPLCRSS